MSSQYLTEPSEESTQNFVAGNQRETWLCMIVLNLYYILVSLKAEVASSSELIF